MRFVLPFVLALAACQQPSASPAAAPGPAPAAAGAPSYGPGADAVVAYWKDGGKLTYADLQKETDKKTTQMLADYLTQRYEYESDALDDKVNDALVAAEAKAAGLDGADALLKKEVEDKTAAPTDQEIQDAYKALSRRLGGKPLDEVRDDVTKAVLKQKQGQRYAEYMDELHTKYGVVSQLPYPDVPRATVSVDDDPAIGPADAPVTIVQFADYQCPYCGRAQDTVDQVMKAYDGKVRFVFRDFPLSFHQNAQPAAIAANCAAKQEKFWGVHDAIMKDQKALSDADLEKLAADNGLDLAKWNECRKDASIADEIQKDEKDGESLGVTGTPAFFINGIFLNGAQPYDKFKAIIDRELAPKKG